MKVKIKDQKVAESFGKKVGDVVEIQDWQISKWVKNQWGQEVADKPAKKEEKVEIETKELKAEKETKDATD
jgi:hypothetical protein